MGFIPDAADVNTHITLLSIGLAALAVAALQKEEYQISRQQRRKKMNIKSVLVLVLKIIVLTIAMFILFSLGASVFTADSAMAQQMSPEEAAASGLGLLIVSFIDTLILIYFILRSRLRGLRLMVVVTLVFYGVKTFTSIIADSLELCA